MAHGPLEYFVIGFDGHKFSGDIAPALKEAADSGVIRIVDLVFVTKDPSGVISKLEYEDFDKETAQAFAALDKNAEGIYSPEDLDEIGASLENDSSAALILVENVWATKVRDAVLRARGRLIYNGILTQETIDALEKMSA